MTKEIFQNHTLFQFAGTQHGGGGQLRIKNCGEIIEINTKLTLKFSITSPPPPSRIRILKILLIRIGGGVFCYDFG